MADGIDLSNVPKFEDLPAVDGAERHSWDVFGRDDEVGTVNFIGPEQVRAAAGLVTTGDVVGLSLPLNEPAPSLSANRTPYEHHFRIGSHGRDDWLDGFYPQFSSQWDGLRHVRYRKFGFFGGRQDGDIESSDVIGIHNWARRGLVTRGILLDVKGYFEASGRELVPDERHGITPAELDLVAQWEGVSPRQGDIVLVRTGWLEWNMSLPPERRSQLVGTIGVGDQPLACPGLDSGRETAAWLWDNRCAAVAADNFALETLPVLRDLGFLHYRLLPLLGMPIGELWWLKDLAAYCARRRTYEFLLTSGVMDIPGGAGSPINAYAVF
jgi:putative cyclase